MSDFLSYTGVFQQLTRIDCGRQIVRRVRNPFFRAVVVNKMSTGSYDVLERVDLNGTMGRSISGEEVGLSERELSLRLLSS